MKPIKTLLAIMIILVSAIVAKAQDSNPKYHLNDNAFKVTKATINLHSAYNSFNNNFVVADAKYHLHDNGTQTNLPTTPVNAQYNLANSNFTPQDAKYHFYDNTAGLTTATFKVFGACGACKQRIENAAKVNGVIAAKWDQSTQLLTVQYNDKITNPDKIQQSEIAVGHDTEKFTSDNSLYNNLPGCCHYQRKS